VSDQYEEAELKPEAIRLGDRTVELDPESAKIVRESFENLAANYGAQLEQFKAQALQTVGTQQPMPQFQPQYGPQGLEIPDPDKLFSNKDAWTNEFQQALEQKLGAADARQAQMVQGAVAAFQQELARRDQASAAQKIHDDAMNEMLDARGLQDHTRIVQAIYHEQYNNLQHLPLKLAFDKIGAMAQEEIDRIRAGERWTVVPNQNEGRGVAPRPPAMLRSVKKAPSAPQTAPETPAYDPNSNLGPMGKILKKRQAALLRGAA
jgi:hypothetical protein